MLRVSVIEHHQRYAMTALALGDQRLWVRRYRRRTGHPAAHSYQRRRRLTGAAQPPVNSSIRNVLPAKVSECLDVDGQVKLAAVGEHVLWARITPGAR